MMYVKFVKRKADPQLKQIIIALIKSVELHPIVLARSYAEAVRYILLNGKWIRRFLVLNELFSSAETLTVTHVFFCSF